MIEKILEQRQKEKNTDLAGGTACPIYLIQDYDCFYLEDWHDNTPPHNDKVVVYNDGDHVEFKNLLELYDYLIGEGHENLPSRRKVPTEHNHNGWNYYDAITDFIKKYELEYVFLYTKLYYPVTKATFLTRKGAEEYLQYQKHNLSPKAHLYIDSCGYANKEWQQFEAEIERRF